VVPGVNVLAAVPKSTVPPGDATSFVQFAVADVVTFCSTLNCELDTPDTVPTPPLTHSVSVQAASEVTVAPERRTSPAAPKATTF
jgi:hypothetical protein